MTLEPTTVVPQNKGISLIARCQSGNEMTFQICVQQRKKLFLYEFVGRFELLSVRWSEIRISICIFLFLTFPVFVFAVPCCNTRN